MADTMPGEVITEEEEIEEPVPAEEELPEEGAPPAAGTTMTHTLEEVPELSGKSVGDVIQLRVTGVSDDGTSFDMEVVPMEEAPPPVAAEEAAAMPGGRGAISEAMLI